MTTVITIGDRVQLKRDKLVGAIRFIGEIGGENGILYGVELDEKKGNNDGSVGMISYFKCALNRGLFVKRIEIVKIIRKNNKNIPRVTVGTKVKCIKAKCNGIIKFIGTPYGVKKDGIYYGIELKEPNGKNNGTINGRCYFECKQEQICDIVLKYGVFVKKNGFLLINADNVSAKPNNSGVLLCFGYVRTIQYILSNHLIIPSEIINICYSYFEKNCRQNILCDLSHFETLETLYRFEFGDVKLVIDPITNKSFALKSFNKSKIIKASFKKYIVNEKNIMNQLNDVWIVNLHKTFKDSSNLYMAIDSCLDGHLLTLLRNRTYFNESTARFYTACCVEATAYLHSKNIIYNNLAPENILLDSNGYVKLSGFAFSFQLDQDAPDYLKDAVNVHDFVKNVDYAAPETITQGWQQFIGKALDWWRVGILIYEMCASFPPFITDEYMETLRKIIRGRIRFPRYFSKEMRDLIRALLHMNPTKRLGNIRGGADNIRQHIWFKEFKWLTLMHGTMKAPIINGNDIDVTTKEMMIKNYYIEEDITSMDSISLLPSITSVDVLKNDGKNADPIDEFDEEW